MSTLAKGNSEAKPRRFPWLLLLLVAAAIYVFWGLPAQMGPRDVKIDYERARTDR